jgi:hypothetical protein
MLSNISGVIFVTAVTLVSHATGSREPISHPAQRIAVDELVLIDGGDGPAVVSRDRNTAAIGLVPVHTRRGEWRQRGAPEK